MKVIKAITILMILMLCLSFTIGTVGAKKDSGDEKIKTQKDKVKDKIKDKDFEKHQKAHTHTKFDRAVAGTVKIKVMSAQNKVPPGFEAPAEGYQTMVSFRQNGKIHVRDSEHKIETLQIEWSELQTLPGFDGKTILITHLDDSGKKDAVWVQNVYNADGYAYLEEMPFSEVIVSGFTGIYQYVPAGNFTADDSISIGNTFDSDQVNYLNASFETIYDDTDPYPQYNTTGLVAWYRFDEGTGTLVQDFSGNGNNGTASGGMGWTDGQIEGAGDFDGVDDYVNCGNDSTINLTNTDDLSISFWVATSNTDTNVLLDKSSDSSLGKGYSLVKSSTGIVRFIYYDGAFPSPEIGSTSKIDDGIPHNVIIAWEADNSRRELYIDGVLENSTSTQTNNGEANDLDLIIGAVSSSKTGNFDGFIDNVMIYNRSLSPTEIEENYQIGYNEYFSKDDPYDIPTRGLVGWWKFDEGSGTNVSDSSGNGNHGTFAAANYTTGKYNAGGDFDGVNDFIDCGNAESLNITDEMTIAFYQNVSDTSLNFPLSKGSETTGFDVASTTNINFRFPGSQIDHQSDAGIIKTNENQYIVITFSSTADEVNFYVDGESSGTVTDTGNLGSTTTGLYIGRRVSNYFDGSIDDVLLYDRALSEEEIEQLYYIKASELKVKTNSNSTYSDEWNSSSDNPISVPFGAGESISALLADNSSSIEQNGITIYEPSNMLFNTSIEVGHLENTTNIYEEVNGDSYQVFIQHIPGVNSTSGTVEFTSDPNDILSSPYLTTGMNTSNVNASMSYNVATREWTVTTGPVTAGEEYNYILYGVLEGSTIEHIVEGGFGDDNLHPYTATGNDTTIVGSMFRATYGDTEWGNESNDLWESTGAMIILSVIVLFVGVIFGAIRRYRE